MKYTLYNYILLFIAIILALYFINYITNYVLVSNKESFLPRFNKMYRPYIRNIRLYSSNKVNSISNKAQVIFKKWGLI